MAQYDGVGPDVLEQQRLDEVHAKSIFARQAMRRDILRDVRVPAEVVREPRRPRRREDVCLAAGRDGHAGETRCRPHNVVDSYPARPRDVHNKRHGERPDADAEHY